MKKNTTKYDLIGKRFGKLVVIEFLGTYRHHSHWLSNCDCGKQTKTRTQNLLSGKTKSCGCGDKERKRKLALELKGRNTKNPADVAEHNIYLDYLKGAKRRGVEFKLSPNDIGNIIYKPCFYCGVEPKNKHRVIRFDGDVFVVYNGIDRVDNSIGYTLENVVPCCRRCNSAKNNMTYEEFVSWVKNVYENLHRVKGVSIKAT